MGSLRFTDIQTRPTEVLDLTSLTLDEFQRLVAPFEVAFEAHMAEWRLDGRPRTARRYTTYTNCPLPTPEDRLLFILVYLKTYPLQVVQGRLFGMGQSKAHQWIHVLFVVLRATLRTLGDAPTRSVQALAKRLGVAEADVAAVVVPAEEPTTSVPPAAAPAPAATSPLLATMALNGASSAPRIRLEQTRCDSGKKRYHTVKNVLLINAALTILFLSETYAGSTHDKRMADATPYPLPAGAGCSRISASWRSRSTTSRSSCRPRSHGAEPSHGRRKPPIDGLHAAASALSMSTAVSSAAASSTTRAACGRRASVT